MSIWDAVDAVLGAPPPVTPPPAAPASDIALPSVWEQADAVLSTPPPLRSGAADLVAKQPPTSVWDEADRVLATSPLGQATIAAAPGKVRPSIGDIFKLKAGPVARPPAAAETPDYGYGPRWNESAKSYSGPPKGLGYFGPLVRPDSDPKGPTVQSEFSIDENIDGKNVSLPTFVPTLTRAEVQALLNLKDGEPIPPGVREKAIAHAKQRISQGRDPFAGPGEQQSVFPDLPRAPVPIARSALDDAKTAHTFYTPNAVSDTTAEGVRQLGKGITEVPGVSMVPLGTGANAHGVPLPADIAPQTMRAANDLIEGLFKASTPAVLATAGMAPVETVLGLAQTMIAGKAGQKAAEIAGASPELQRLASNVAAVAGGMVGAGEVMDSIRRDAKVVVDQLRADPDAGVGLNIGGVDIIKPRPGGSAVAGDEPINVGRGATPAAGARPVDASVVRAESPAATEVHADILTPRTRAAVDELLSNPPAAPADVVEATSDTLSPQTRADIDKLLGPPAVADRLDTGELQPRLPGDVGQVRDQTAAAPPVADVPFALTPEAATRTAAAPGLNFGAPAAPDSITVKASDGPPPQAVAPVPEGTVPEGTVPEGVPAPRGDTAPSVVDGDAGARVQAPAAGTLPATRGASGARPSRTSSTRQQESDVIDRLVGRARADGFVGDHRQLTTALQDRADALRELHKDTYDAGATPGALLEAIVKAGGISRAAETGQKGEIDWLKQSGLAKRKGLFHESGGLPLDGVVEALQQDTRFPHIRDINDLVAALTDVAASNVRDTTAITPKALGAVGDRWWDCVLPTAAAHGALDLAHEGPGDISFDPAELEQQATAADEWRRYHDAATIPERALDWGPRAKGSGKRLGNGQVRGGMSDAPTGVKRYPDYEHAEGVTPERWKELRVLDEVDQRAAIGALQAGRSFDEAMRIAYHARDTTPQVASSSTGAPRAQKPKPPSPVPPKRSGAATIDSTLVPGGRQFLERDVSPSLVKAAAGAVELRRGIRAVWAPDTVSPEAVTGAAIIRPNLSITAQRDARARTAMHGLEKAFDRVPLGTKDDEPSAGTQLAFARAIDEGRESELPPALRDAAKILSDQTALYRKEATATGLLHNWLAHYFPREWVQPGKVRELLLRAGQGKKPLQGRQRYRKARSRKEDTGEIYSFREMLDRGFTPVEPNPVRAYLRKWSEMNKSLTARRIILQGKQAGTSMFVRVGGKALDGWQRYDDSFGTVYGKPTVTIHEAYDDLLMRGLNDFVDSIGATHERKATLGGRGKWGDASWPSGRIRTKFGGPETVLMHEIGHILDYKYGLGNDIGLGLAAERREEINFGEKSSALKELTALADLRDEGTPRASIAPGRRAYLHKREETIANLVHAFIYNPVKAREVAPNAYWALHNLAKDTPTLRPLIELQQTRSLKLGTAKTEVGIGGALVLGHYYGPPDVVRLLNHYLSPGFSGNAAFDLFRRTSNALRNTMLSLSAFHFLGTSMNAVFMKSSLGLQAASRGDWRTGLKALAQSPVAPLLDVVEGHQILKAFYAKDATMRTVLGTADAMVRGGMRGQTDRFWQTSAPEQFVQAFKSMVTEAEAGNYPGAALRLGQTAWRAIPALIELQARPVMTFWVPRLKAAAYMQRYLLEVHDLGDRPDELELRKAASHAAAAVDNVYGQLAYDNLFWHNGLKDAGMSAVMALGWDVGTVRHVFGAIPAQLRSAGALPDTDGQFGRPTRVRNTGTTTNPDTGKEEPVYEEGKAPWLTDKFAYFVSMLFWSAMFGALYQKLNTGLNPGEQEDGSIDLKAIALDVYFPRTGGVTNDGRPERASPPTYMKDLYAFTHHPITTTVHKLNPLLSLAGEIIDNQDYFGNGIRNSEDPWLQQLEDMFAFAGRQYRPISVQSYFERQQNKTKGGAISGIESFLGINTAPGVVTRTDLENYLHEIRPPTSRTKEQADAATMRRDIRTQLEQGDRDGARQAAVTAGMTDTQWKAAQRTARMTSLQRAFQRTSIREALHGYEIATPDERAQLKPLLEGKAARTVDVPADERPTLVARVKAALALPVAKPRAPVAAKPPAPPLPTVASR